MTFRFMTNDELVAWLDGEYEYRPHELYVTWAMLNRREGCGSFWRYQTNSQDLQGLRLALHEGGIEAREVTERLIATRVLENLQA